MNKNAEILEIPVPVTGEFATTDDHNSEMEGRPFRLKLTHLRK